MQTNHHYFAIVSLLAFSTTGFAAPPPVPGMTSGSGDHGMKHAGVGLAGNTLSVHYEPAPGVPLTMMPAHGVDFTPAKFDVLENVYLNAQYGWLPESAFSPPANRSVWIERTNATQPVGATFRVFEAGNMSTAPGEGMAHWTMNEIYAADGDRWQWDGKMQHDFYTANLPGHYSISFDVFIGDLAGGRDSAYMPASTVFEFVVVPEPTTFALVAFGIVVPLSRRR